MTERVLRPNVLSALEALRNDPKLQPINDPPLRKVASIQFGILSEEEILGMSVCHVTNPRITQPPTDTVYDERMGPAQCRTICSTCNEDIRICPGHFGHIKLAVPIIHPMFTKFLVKILNCICIKCSKLKMSREEIDLEINVIEHDRYIRYLDRLDIITKKCSDVPYCKDCEFPYPEIKEDEDSIYEIYRKTQRSRLEVEELITILKKISDENLSIMGFRPTERKVLRHGKIIEYMQTFRPERLIITVLPVLPPISRPPNNDGDNRSDDDLTTSYTSILKYNERLKGDLNEMDKTTLLTLLKKEIKGLFDNSDGAVIRSSGKVAKGIKERISGKDGHIRGKLVGKRVDSSARTVITGDPNLKLNQIGIPKCIAFEQSFPEKVTGRNIEKLRKALEEGRVNTILRNGNQVKVKYAQEAGRRLKLHFGDIVCRQLKDKDTIVFNRQPTLHRGSMMAHEVKILPGKTFRLNLSVTTPYNADFDGDEMQAHIPQDYGTVAEVQELMGVNKMIVSAQGSRPIMGVIQDSLLGSYLMTHKDVKIPRKQFMDCIFSAGEIYVSNFKSFLKRASMYYTDLFCGRVLFSILLPHDFHYSSKNNASLDEPTVIIEHGILKQGIIDKKIIGRSHGSIVHRLYKEYSPERSAEFLTSVQFLVNRWLSYRGFSVGAADFIINPENERGVEDAIQKAYIEVKTIEKSDEPPNIKEFKINNALNNRGQKLAINGLCKNNRLEVMINSGSKGSKMNIIQIAGHLGQNNVNGQRIQCEIDNGTRTLSCFSRGDTHPVSRGFVESSFKKGLSPPEVFFHAKAGREGLINTAVKTRDSGYTERKLVKRTEDLTVCVDHTIRNSVNNIISFSYGDSLNPTMMYKDTFIDIDNIVERLNKGHANTKQENLFDINTDQRRIEIQKEIEEYKQTIEVLKKRKGVCYKNMLKIAKEKLLKLEKSI